MKWGGRANSFNYLCEQLHSSDTLLLDFDGPICSVFAGLPAGHVAEAITRIADGGKGALVDSLYGTANDPFAVLRRVYEENVSRLSIVERELTNYEILAVDTAVPTVGSHELIYRWIDRGGRTAIVSNNSVSSIGRYLQRHRLPNEVSVFARRPVDVGRLKPDKYLVQLALDSLGADPRRTIFVGDSPTDIQAGKQCGVATLGFANKSHKFAELSKAGANFVESSMLPLLDCLM